MPVVSLPRPSSTVSMISRRSSEAATAWRSLTLLKGASRGGAGGAPPQRGQAGGLVLDDLDREAVEVRQPRLVVLLVPDEAREVARHVLDELEGPGAHRDLLQRAVLFHLLSRHDVAG